MGRLEGKSAVITGGAGGIGRATALKMAAEGARVMVADTRSDASLAVVDEIESKGGWAAYQEVDLGTSEDVSAMIAVAVERLGGLDILHNNAAATDQVTADHDIATVDLAVWERTMAVNLRGVMVGCRAAIPIMESAGRGVIINTTSISAVSGDLRYSSYGISKGGVNALTVYVATQYGKSGIRCNAVAPGLVLTPHAYEIIPSEDRAEYERQHLTPRLGRPEDVGNLVAFLASDEAEFITGQIIAVDGGLFSHNPTVAAFR